ncbi:cytochrome c biogenesis CcdA family protein [Rhodoferax sp.]|uniref:cytochrome c biogenesis CcdA family protein n=1 Tax=Rhodoferax sp. TaxID=50421 RepID=UPI00374CE8A4
MASFADLGLSVAAGSLTTLSPCVFPLLPLVLGGATQRHRAAPIAMGLGMVATFVLLGVLLGVLGDSLGLSPDSVRSASAWLLTAFGVVMLVPWLNRQFTLLTSPLASSAQQASQGLDAGSLKGALLVGGLLGLVWSPCSGPLLGSALTLVASEGGAGRGALILGLFGLGAALPLVAAAYASRSAFGRVRSWVQAHGEQSKKVFGACLLMVGLAILSGADRWVETQVTTALPDGWVRLTTSL